MENPFKWRHFQPEIILLAVRWYLRYALSYRDLEEMISERGLSLDHTTIYRWVQRYAPELDKRSRPYLKQTNDSWQVDETYVKVRGNWMFLYRAVDSTGQTLDFLLNQTRRLNYPTLNNIQVLEQPNGFSEKFWVGLTSPLHGLSMSTRTPPTLAPSVT